MQHIEAVRQLPNRPVQHEDVQDELQHHSQRHLAGSHAFDPQPQKQRHAGRRQHFDDGKEDGERPDGADVGRPVGAVVDVEFLALCRLTAKGLDDVHPRDMLLHEDVDARHFIADTDKGLFYGFLENAGRHQQHRDGQQDKERQLDVDPEHGPDDDDQLEHISDRIEQSIGKHIRNAIHVADVAGDKLAHRRLVKVLEPETRHVSKEGRTQVERHALSDPIGPIGLPELKQRLDDNEAHHPQENPQKPSAVACGNVVVEGDANEERPHPRQPREQDHKNAR